MGICVCRPVRLTTRSAALTHGEVYTEQVAPIRFAIVCVPSTRIPARGKSTVRIAAAARLAHMADWGRPIAERSCHLLIWGTPCICVRVLNGRRGYKSYSGGNRVPWGPSTSACRSSSSTSGRRLGGKRVRDGGSQVPWGPDTSVCRPRTCPCLRRRGSDWTFDGGSRVPWGPNTSVGSPLASASRWQPFRNRWHRWHPPRTATHSTCASKLLLFFPHEFIWQRWGRRFWTQARRRRWTRQRRPARPAVGLRSRLCLRCKIPSSKLWWRSLVRNS